MCWFLWSLSVICTSIQDLLVFRASTEKLGVIPIILPLYVTRPFSFAILSIVFFLFCMFSVLLFGKEGAFFFFDQSIWCFVSILYLHGYVPFQVGNVFLYDFSEYIFCAFMLNFHTGVYTYYSQILVFHGGTDFLDIYLC